MLKAHIPDIPFIQAIEAAAVHVPLAPHTNMFPYYDIQIVEGTIITAENECSLPAPTEAGRDFLAFFPCLFGVAVCLAVIFFELFLAFSGPTVTILLLPKAQTITVTATMQQGRLLLPITLSQSGERAATGTGHQNATYAHGAVTLYNGEFNQVTIPAGMVVTGEDGFAVATDEAAVIPRGTPPTYGQTTVSAHAIQKGIQGNIPAYDINQACCMPSVLAKNTTAFSGGQDERDFKTVTATDISTLAATLKQHLLQPIQATLTTKLHDNETLYPLPCSPTVSGDHRIGEEATRIRVTVSETCTGIAYDKQRLLRFAWPLLTAHAAQQLGTGYSLVGNVQVIITQARVIQSQALLTISCLGTWVYYLGHQTQATLTHLIAGKTKQQALDILTAQPGIQEVSIEGVNDALPKSSTSIHLVVLQRVA